MAKSTEISWFNSLGSMDRGLLPTELVTCITKMLIGEVGMKSNWNMTCPFCNKSVNYWPNCSPSTSLDYYDWEWVMHGKVKQFFHRSCYMKSTRRATDEREN